MSLFVKKNSRKGKSKVSAASWVTVEAMESRVMLSTTITAWSFDNLAVAANILSPAPSTGTGTALTVGLQTSGSNANSPGGVYAYPNPNASGTGDTSDILNGTGNNPPSGSTVDQSSGGQTGAGNATGVDPAWRIRGASDGWSGNAAIASQGAQFATSTVGDSGISLKFDLDPSSGGAASEIAVQYTTDGGTSWTEASATELLGGTVVATAANGTTDGVTIATNSSNSSLITGAYYQIANNADALWWQDGFTVNLSDVSAVNNNANFGVRIVNAATGAAEFEVTGTGAAPIAFPAAGSGNWRIDNVQILAVGAALSTPVINSNPTNQTVPAGQPVTFTAAASGNPAPTVQWFMGAVGSGTAIDGATSTSFTFTTSATATDNGNTYYAVFTNSQGSASTTAASLSDALAAPVVTTQPSPVSITGGNSASFTAAVTGSPLPTAQWQSGASATGPFTPISGATSLTYTIPSASTTQSGTYFEAVFTNSQGSVTTTAVKLTVSGATIAAWNFPAVVAAPDNSPAATAGSGTAISLGMTNVDTYAATTATNSVTSDDITSVAGTSPAVTDNVWRIRGAYVATGVAPNIGSPTKSGNVNGWNLAAAQYSQGAEFDVSTVGYQTIAATFDWEATAQGVRDLQEQYNTNTANSGGWTNINSLLVANPGQYLVANPIDLSGISGANNDPNFGLRLVSAYDPSYTGTGSPTYTSATLTGGNPVQYNNSSGNWGFDNIMVTGTQLPAAPLVTTQPANQSVVSGTNATFTAVASGFPTPTIQWMVSANGGTSFTNDTTDAGNTTGTLTVVGGATNNNNEYEAVFTNTQGSATSNAATLTVTTAPIIVTQPQTQYVNAGSLLSLTSTATGNPTPTVQWEVSTNGGTTFAPISGATTSPFIFTATEATSGDEYEAIFTNSAGSATSTPATITVVGTPIAQWNFTGGEAPPSGGDTTPGTGNSPFPTFGLQSNSAGTLGFNNDYTGVEAFPESDILIERSTLNSNFSEYDWRIRAGNGTGPTGSPGSPEGWSQTAPQYAQGVQFDVNTTGESNITLHFDWNQGGISDMQPRYSLNGGSSWTNLPNGLIEQAPPSGDFYGITATTAPTGILVNLQSISGANNNPNFELQLVAAYNSTLPLITDGNQTPGVPTSHGQFATGVAGAVNAQQVIQFGNDLNPDPGTEVNGGTFTLTYNGLTTGPISYSTTPATLITNITTALTALTGLAGNFTVGQTNYSGGLLLQPERDALGEPNNNMTVTFNGALAAMAVPTMTINGAGLTGGNTNVSVATWVNGSAMGFKPYIDGSGAWQIGNISFNGDSTAAGGLAILTQPASSTSITSTAQLPITASFTATAYSEVSPTTAQWQVSTNRGSTWVNASGASGANISNAGFNYSSTYTLPIDMTTDQNNNEYRVVFTASATSVTSAPATLNVVLPQVPIIILQPLAISVQAGNIAVFTSTATGAPMPTVQWQISSNGGTSYSNISGATSSTLNYSTLSNASESGDVIRAVFANEAGITASTAVTMTVLTAETTITKWNFANHASSGTGAIDNSPAPTGGVVDAGAAIQIGMTLPYDPADAATGTLAAPTGFFSSGDVTNTPGALNTNFNENTWRVRGGSTVDGANGGTPANGWSNLQPALSQGVQFSVPTTGYSDVYVTMDWYSTTSGILDGQLQYTTGGTTANETITNEALANNLVTMTVNDPNLTFSNGDAVTITGLAAPFIGTFFINSTNPGSISGLSTSTFTYYVTGANPNVANTAVNGQASDLEAAWTNYGPQIQAVSNDFYGATAANASVVTAEALTTNVATLTASNTFAVGQTVNVSGAGSPFNGQFVITAATPSTFSYAVTGTDISQTTVTGSTAFVGGLPIPLVIDVSQIAGAANNPNFGIRLVSAYNPILSNTQTLELGDNHNFTLTFNGKTTGNIAFSSSGTTMAANIQAALAALTNIGAGNVTVAPGEDGYTVTFGTTMDNAVQPAISISDLNDDDVYTPQYANAALVGSPPGPAPYNGSKGNWRFDNIVFHGNALAVAPTLVSAVVGDGTNQRSSVSSIAMTFSEAVHLPVGSFTLYQEPVDSNGNLISGSATDVTSGVTATTTDNITWTISVNAGGILDRTAASTAAGLFGDGIYQLVLHGAQITDSAIGTADFNAGADQIAAMATNLSGNGGTSNYFHVLFGDSNGDGTVNTTDYFQFKQAFISGTGNSFDFNGDGSVNTTDYFQFKKEFSLGLTFNYPTM